MYHNYEGFTFPVDGPYLEFPLEQDSAYDGGKSARPENKQNITTGREKKLARAGDRLTRRLTLWKLGKEMLMENHFTGSPGADRCIINESGDYAGSITHTGASGDDFVGCSGTS